MQYRERDGLTLAISIGLMFLGLLICWYTTGGRDPSKLFVPRPIGPLWLDTMMEWQEMTWWGVMVLSAGALYLWHWGGWPMLGWLRVGLTWGVLALVWDLLIYRAMGVWTANAPPWPATAWLTGLAVALTIRRVADLHKVWRGRDA